MTPRECIEQTIKLWCVPGYHYELRCPKAGEYRVVSGYFKDFDRLANEALRWSGAAEAVYLTLNPVDPVFFALAANRTQIYAKKTASDADIVRRFRLLIDADPVRPNGLQLVSSTNDELKKALQCADRIQQFLTTQGWPEPLFGHSGNGGHLLYAIDLPNDEESTSLIQCLLENLNHKFGDSAVQVDTTVFNPSRICKLYGTKACKADHTDERPHRHSQIIKAPKTLATVPLDAIKPLATKSTTQPSTNGKAVAGTNNTPKLTPASTRPKVAWMEEFITTHNIEVYTRKEGGGRWAYRWEVPCPFCGEQDGAAAIVLMTDGRYGYTCLHNRCSGKQDTKRSWRDFRQHYEPEITDATAGFISAEDLLERVCGEEYFAADPPAVPKKQSCGSKFVFNPIWAADFAQANYTREWLVKGVLVKTQPCIIGGPKKSLKTSVLIDLMLSLGTGVPFLGHWEVPKSVRTVLISGESGEATLQETAKRVAEAKHIRWGDGDYGILCRLPQLGFEEDLAELTAGLLRNKVEAVIIDPLYLCLLAGLDKNAANIFEMGPLLLSVAEACREGGAQALLCHHTKKNLNAPYDPLDLEDLAYSGVAEFARQWLLLSRRILYVPGTGLHHLWLQYGGSFGHGGLMGLDIEEGVLDDDFGGRQWKAEVMTLAEAKEQKKVMSELQQKEKKDQADVREGKELLKLLCKHTGEYSVSKTQSDLGWFKPKFQRILNRLENAGWIELYEGCSAGGHGAAQSAKVAKVTRSGYEALK
jgi:hypothetical protein